jgi:hypothetical protein
MQNIESGAGAASRYGSGSAKMMRLLATPAPTGMSVLGWTMDNGHRQRGKHVGS